MKTNNDPRYDLFFGNSMDVYSIWPEPDVIISDGAYGLRGFPGDPSSVDQIIEWYMPHVLSWSKYVKPSTSLWFWNTEVGWATMHPILLANGWEYVQLGIWDKGLSHIAGNVNGNTIRQFPVVSEVSALYRRALYLKTGDGRTLSVKEWLRAEWERSGLPLYKANEACGVKNAATRKYLTQDWLWYWPPGEAVQAMSDYCNKYGYLSGKPYFQIDNKPVTTGIWDNLRAVWNHRNGITNVWSRPPLSNTERLKGTLEKSAPRMHKATKMSAAHLNQKPLDLMINQIYSTTNENGVVWEPFGGLASASVAAVLLGRKGYVAEINKTFADIAENRLKEAENNYYNNGIITI